MVNENYSFRWMYERNDWAAYAMVAGPLLVLGLVLIMHRFCRRPVGNIYKPHAQGDGGVYQTITERQPFISSTCREADETCTRWDTEPKVLAGSAPEAQRRSTHP